MGSIPRVVTNEDFLVSSAPSASSPLQFWFLYYVTQHRLWEFNGRPDGILLHTGFNYHKARAGKEQSIWGEGVDVQARLSVNVLEGILSWLQYIFTKDQHELVVIFFGK